MVSFYYSHTLLCLEWCSRIISHKAMFFALFSFLFRVRFHYGHPDVFDRLFHLTRGGVSKASKIINLSEDIFAGKFLFMSCS